jgi:hypothetical protein
MPKKATQKSLKRTGFSNGYIDKQMHFCDDLAKDQCGQNSP